MRALPSRKPIRLKNYDYSTPGAYFVTICTKDRKCLLSRITVGTGLPDGPQNELTIYGIIAKKHIENMKDFYNNIRIDKYVIMPNHIHFIIRILKIEEEKRTVGTPVPTNSLIARFMGTFKRFCNREYGENIWQSRSNDHIIRGKNDYLKIWEYIDANPIRWELDRFYTE